MVLHFVEYLSERLDRQNYSLVLSWGKLEEQDCPNRGSKTIPEIEQRRNRNGEQRENLSHVHPGRVPVVQ
jgi:hypothetical protein